MTTMRSMNPEAPRFVNATSAAQNYANLVNTPRYAIANQFFDNLKKERMAEELREEELRRYNQGFALQQAQADRQQAMHDRTLNSDKALVDYQNIIHGTAQGGILDNTQGQSLANEYQSLINSGVSEEEAAKSINTKAQMLAQQDAKKAQANPYYAANKVQGVAINGNRYGEIDPTELINLQRNMVNDLNKEGDSLRDYNLQSNSKNREQLLKEQERIIKIQQLRAMGYNPNALAESQWDAIIKSKPENKKFDIVTTKDSNGKDILDLQLVDNQEVKERERVIKETEHNNKYNSLLQSKELKALAEADTFGNKTAEIVDIARKARIPYNIVEGIVLNKNVNNASNWADESLKYKDFNKFKVQDPTNPDQWRSLGDWLENLQSNPDYLEQVSSGVAFPNLVQMSQQEIKEREAKEKELKDKNFNPFKLH